MLLCVIRGERAPSAGYEPPGSSVDLEGAVERGVHGVRSASTCARAAARPRPACTHARQGINLFRNSNVNESA